MKIATSGFKNQPFEAFFEACKVTKMYIQLVCERSVYCLLVFVLSVVEGFLLQALSGVEV